MTQLQAIRWFADFAAGTHVTIARMRDDWGMGLGDLRHPRLILPKDLLQNDEMDKMFRQDFVARCPLAQGFANVTISILHEIGHYMFPCEYLTTDPAEYDKATGWDHFKLECEVVATNWAIEWLQDKNHRKVAKEFERDFYGRS